MQGRLRRWGLAGLCVTAGLSAAYSAASETRVLYAPDVVSVGRLFLIALKVPIDTPKLDVKVPKAFVMFDRTPLPPKSEARKFYFRAKEPTKHAEIVFALPSGKVVIPVAVWSFKDLRAFRKLKGVQLPRRWPLGEWLPELKQKQTFPTGAETRQPKRKDRGGWLAFSDDDIWAMQPDSTIPRWHWTNIVQGCPIHGREIYRKRAYYPWLMDSTFPWRWKIRCPVGGEEYPSNDFAHGDMTSGPFPDDGIGGGCLYKGNKYGFIAELCQFYCRRMMLVAPQCAGAYVRTGDRRYAHKALVALSRLAVEYAYLATMTHHRHRNNVGQVERLGQGRFADGPYLRSTGFTTYPIEQPGQLITHAEAYDRIFPVIDQDEAIIPFLRRKGFDVKTHEDVRRFIEENLFAVWMQGIMDGACDTNDPGEQEAILKAALVLNYKRGTDFIDWLYDGDGRMRVFVPNDFFRDGSPYEATGGYNSVHVTRLTPIVDDMERLRQLRPQVYLESRYPRLSARRRYRSIFDFCMDTVLIDRTYPQIGDSGSWPTYSKLPRIPWHSANAAAFEHAYRVFRDPKFAWALANSPGWRPSADFPFTREQIEREAAKWPNDWNDRSSLHDGYGIAILRSGTGEQKRALWLRYGRARSHVQDDLMDVGLAAYQGVLLSSMGYPRNWSYWERAWSSHNVARQIPFVNMTAQAELFAESGPVRVAEVRAQAFLDRVMQDKGYVLLPEQWQRRLLALVDVGPDRFYCVDFYRLSGGREHWWAFHCQEGDFRTDGIELTAQPRGTLAGPDVPYGDPKWLKANGCSHGVYCWSGPMFPFAHLYNVQHGQATGPWTADWKLKTGDGLHVRLTVVEADGSEVNICDGRAPAGGPYEMKWIMLHHRPQLQPDEPARTQVVSLIEPHFGTPAIQRAVPLRVKGEDGHGFSARACQVRLGDTIDTLLFSANPRIKHQIEDGIRFSGRFGFWREKDGLPVAITLMGGTELSKGRFSVQLEQPEYRGRIVRVDRSTETITVAPVPFNPASVVGEVVFLTNEHRRVAYKVLEAERVSDGVTLRLNWDSRIGVGRATSTTDHRVQTDTPFTLQGYRYYHGARIVGPDGRTEYRILGVRSRRAVFLDTQRHPEATADQLARDFPQGSWFAIYDYGVGDEIVWPYAVSLTLETPGHYRLTAPVPVTVQLPEGATVSRGNPSNGRSE
ncbi:MAG: hypothetical protein GXP27_00120 [Planctomycetes bacterium]|nr:hypothetical protein [Planctomycetota bacterium]